MPPRKRTARVIDAGAEAQKRVDRVARRAAGKPEGGNTNPDRVWIEEVQSELHPPDETTRPDTVLGDFQFQWTGYADELNTEFFESFRRNPDGPKCTGEAYVRDGSGMYIVDADWHRLRRPCLKYVRKGSVVCDSHGGRIPQVKAAAVRRLAEASDTVAERLVALTTPNGITEDKVRLAAMNSVLDRAGIRGGVDVGVQVSGFGRVMEDLFGPEADNGDEG